MQTSNSLRFCSIFLFIFLLNSCATPSKVTPENLKSLAPTADQFSSQWVSITMGGMMAFPETGPALALNLANKSNTNLDVTVSFKAPDHKQRCEVTKHIKKNSSTFFQCPQTSITTNIDYPITVAIHTLGELGEKQLVETSNTKFRFSEIDAKAFFEQLRKALKP